MKDKYIDNKLKNLQTHFKNDKLGLMCNIWDELKQNNKHYADILNVINNLSSAEDFNTIKNLLESLF